MTNNPQNLVEVLYNKYKDEPIIYGLIEAIAFPVPANFLIETFVGSYVTKMVASRLHSFYEELNNGDFELTEEIIENEEFLHSYFSVVNYVARSKSDEKSKQFAKIIKGLYKNEINVDQFEDYTSIFNELSEREFAILCIKLKHEQKEVSVPQLLRAEMPISDPYNGTMMHWPNFIKEVESILEISDDELSSFLIRIQRTGCYKIHFGQYNDKEEGVGDTTIIFQKLYNLVKE